MDCELSACSTSTSPLSASFLKSGRLRTATLIRSSKRPQSPPADPGSRLGPADGSGTGAPHFGRSAALHSGAADGAGAGGLDGSRLAPAEVDGQFPTAKANLVSTGRLDAAS
jgi:hypothetical protein